jgi:AraC-like DNA-binding protein
MPLGRFLTFEDPDRFQASIRAPSYEMLAAARNGFRAAVTRIDLDRLWMHRTAKNGPAMVRSMSDTGRLGIMFLADPEQAPPLRNGMELSAQDVVVHRPGAVNHLWSRGPNRLAMMSLGLEDAAAVGQAIVGREIEAPSETLLIRPAASALARLRALHESAGRLVRSEPDAFNGPAVTRSLEHDLIHAMITCLAGHSPADERHEAGSHAKVMARFEDFLTARHLEPVYLAEICAAIGTSERTLRAACHERFGMGPMRYLWLRRMQLARQALRRADPARATVTAIATDHGFWELGRFSVEYRGLFGEPPVATLRRPAQEVPAKELAN